MASLINSSTFYLLESVSNIWARAAYIENVLLDDGVDDDADKQVEEDTKRILEARGVVCNILDGLTIRVCTKNHHVSVFFHK